MKKKNNNNEVPEALRPFLEQIPSWSSLHNPDSQFLGGNRFLQHKHGRLGGPGWIRNKHLKATKELLSFVYEDLPKRPFEKQKSSHRGFSSVSPSSSAWIVWLKKYPSLWFLLFPSEFLPFRQLCRFDNQQLQEPTRVQVSCTPCISYTRVKHSSASVWHTRDSLCHLYSHS